MSVCECVSVSMQGYDTIYVHIMIDNECACLYILCVRVSQDQHINLSINCTALPSL